jgi:dipeptidyl aminopeptidase/acylaminoacyl peptidase
MSLLSRRTLPRLLAAAAFAVLSTLPGLVTADQPPLISRDILFGNPERSRPRLSPDGQRLAWIAPDKKNVLQVWVKTVGKDDDKMVTADKKRGIRQYFWAQDNWTLLYQQDNDGDENFHVYGADLVSGTVRDYTPFQGVRAEVADLNPDFPDQILVEMNLRSRESMDIHRIDLRSGAVALDTENPGDVAGWGTDAKFQVRSAQAQTPDGGTEIRVRDDTKSPWRTLLKVGPDEILEFQDFSLDGKTAVLKSSIGNDTARLVERNLATGAERVVASSTEVDAGPVVIQPKTHVVQAVGFAPGRVAWKVLDPSVQADFDGIAKLAPGDFSVVDRTAKDDRWLVAFTSDRGPVWWWVWDRASKSGTKLFTAQPKLEGLMLAGMKPIVIKSRDGLALNSYLTVPAGLPAKNLPMVLFVHGGP